VLLALSSLAVAVATGCQARSSVEVAQTAVVVAQTALPVAQAGSERALTVLQGLLSGATLDIKTSPDGADNPDVTDVSIDATDSRNAIGQIDPRARQAMVATALLATAQAYPNATIELEIVDGSGNVLASGRVAPGQTPSVQ
jgi:hypothetical protein